MDDKYLKAALGLCCNSRKVQNGDVFVAVRGVEFDGHDFITQAVERGASVIIAERSVEVPESVKLVKVANSAVALGELAQAAAGQPSRELTSLAVTGTNGKTTVAYLTRWILNSAGLSCAMVGTIEYDLGGGEPIPASNTTPGALELAEMMRRMVSNGAGAVIMECSSHGLDQDRMAGIHFDAAAFTNLSGDHLDYHGTSAEYLTAKSKLFSALAEDSIAIINIQDQAGEKLTEITRGRVWRYGIDAGVEIDADIKTMGLGGCEFVMTLPGESVLVRSGLVGEHNVYNCLAAAGLARAAGVGATAVKEAIEQFPGVPGRLERVDEGGKVTVFVDYAHTDDALNHVLGTLRKYVSSKLIVVFGCGGQRDQSKRPRMAAVAEKWADVVVVTNDNPRKEDPKQIIEQIRAGFSEAGLKKMTEIPDRREAICYALKKAQPDDVVLIAGKGHENYQLIGDEKRHFDDREVAKKELRVL
ncbi:MAG: UDP-N-acetylmuramoyl-L-alanyl-D-glutamate--2,6-diaminopimelate ligase [Sedimentisphaerales bacterium]|nr:UDP-N-acetylmuramoyl-L-alanyl-D-glutamate--2,6-diaminopimelate ligase [Sedimentisphaerales bacterium]